MRNRSTSAARRHAFATERQHARRQRRPTAGKGCAPERMRGPRATRRACRACSPWSVAGLSSPPDLLPAVSKPVNGALCSPRVHFATRSAAPAPQERAAQRNAPKGKVQGVSPRAMLQHARGVGPLVRISLDVLLAFSDTPRDPRCQRATHTHTPIVRLTPKSGPSCSTHKVQTEIGARREVQSVPPMGSRGERSHLSDRDRLSPDLHGSARRAPAASHAKKERSPSNA